MKDDMYGRLAGRHNRRSIRLKGYDYTQAGAYFATICTQNRACLFGDVVDGVMRLNGAGRMVAVEWALLPKRFPNVQLDAMVVMPNHLHGIIVITDPAVVGAGLVPAPTAPHRATTRVSPTVGDVVGAFKSRVTVEYTRGVKTSGWLPFSGRLWQRNYYEHIIRNEESLNRIRQYIANNPLRWELDIENPGCNHPGTEET
jgi:putative transposase